MRDDHYDSIINIISIINNINNSITISIIFHCYISIHVAYTIIILNALIMMHVCTCVVRLWDSGRGGLTCGDTGHASPVHCNSFSPIHERGSGGCVVTSMVTCINHLILMKCVPYRARHLAECTSTPSPNDLGVSQPVRSIASQPTGPHGLGCAAGENRLLI